MPSLHELQRAFAAALHFEELAAIEPQVLTNGIDPADRLRIYRNNTRETFLSTVRAAFPVLERLVGAGYFRQLALDYQERFPSTSGDLQHAGRHFSIYLQRRFGASEYAYFTDVARLEWAYQEVLVAADHAPLDPGRLRNVPCDAYPSLAFRLHPAARLVDSAYPLLTIWAANQPDRQASQAIIDLRQGGERVLVHRARDAVDLERLPPDEFTFLTAIATGASMADATSAAASSAASFDLGLSLRRWVNRGVIVDFYLSAHSHPETES